jgi:DNA polymerase III epsilon subunit-like protein
MFLEGCDLGGYNIRNFDVPMLIKEFSRTNINFSMEGRRVVDAYFIFCQKEPRSLTGAYKFFCGKEFDQAKAHGAEFDTLATVEVFEASSTATEIFRSTWMRCTASAIPSVRTGSTPLVNSSGAPRNQLSVLGKITAFRSRKSPLTTPASSVDASRRFPGRCQKDRHRSASRTFSGQTAANPAAQ